MDELAEKVAELTPLMIEQQVAKGMANALLGLCITLALSGLCFLIPRGVKRFHASLDAGEWGETDQMIASVLKWIAVGALWLLASCFLWDIWCYWYWPEVTAIKALMG